MLFGKYQYSEGDIEKRGYSHHCILTSEDGKRFWNKWILGIGKEDTKIKMLTDRLRKLQGAKHPCLPDIVEYGFDEEYRAYAIVYNYLQNAESLENRTASLDMQRIMSGLIDIAECLNLLHANHKINHGDLHPGNIFVDIDGQFFLIDFQLSETTRIFSQEKYLEIFTAAFSAPEKLKNISGGFPYQADIYSLGKIIDWIFREKHETIPEEQSKILQRILAEKPVDRLQWQEVIDFLKKFPVFAETKNIKIAFSRNIYPISISKLNSVQPVFDISPNKPDHYDFFTKIIIDNLVINCGWKEAERTLIVNNIDYIDKKNWEGEKLPFKVAFVENAYSGVDLSPYFKKWFAKKQSQRSLRLQSQEIKKELSFYRTLLGKELEVIQNNSIRLQYDKWTTSDDGELLFFIKAHEKNSDRAFLAKHIDEGNAINSDGKEYVVAPNADRKQTKNDVEFAGKPYEYEKSQSKKPYDEKSQDDEHDVFIFKIKDVELNQKKKESMPLKGYLFESTRQKEEEKRRQIDAITKTERSEAQNSKLIYTLFNPHELPTAYPCYDPLDHVYQKDNNGNDFVYSANQNKAIRNALTKQPLSVIQGPPGTGKTTVITEIVFQILAKKPQAKILITSQTNNAVDQVLENLLKNSIPILRLSGMAEPKIKEIREHTLHKKLDSWKLQVQENAKSNFDKLLQQDNDFTNKPDFSELYKLHHDWINVVSALDEKSDINKKLIDSIRVIGATCNHIAAAKYRDYKFNFDYIIMDEAGKATIAESLVPLVMGNNLVFVGDHRQLRPMLTTTWQVEEWLREQYKKEAAELEDWDDYFNRPSLFEQVITQIDPDYKSQLTECRRLPAEQVVLTSKYFYESEGDEPIEAVPRDSSAEHCLPLAVNAPLFFIDIGSSYNNAKDSEKSSYNTESAKIVLALLKHLNKYEKVKEYSFGVIVCYKAQYRSLKRDIDRLKGKRELNNICKWQNVEDKFTVSVVDRFQGLERDIIILDLVKSGAQLNLGFMEVPNRINVALSRNKRLLFIVGDYNSIVNATTKRLQEKKAALQEYLEGIKQEWIVPAENIQGLFR